MKNSNGTLGLCEFYSGRVEVFGAFVNSVAVETSPRFVRLFIRIRQTDIVQKGVNVWLLLLAVIIETCQ
jgi:hypothetical protein